MSWWDINRSFQRDYLKNMGATSQQVDILMSNPIKFKLLYDTLNLL